MLEDLFIIGLDILRYYNSGWSLELYSMQCIVVIFSLRQTRLIHHKGSLKVDGRLRETEEHKTKNETLNLLIH